MIKMRSCKLQQQPWRPSRAWRSLPGLEHQIQKGNTRSLIIETAINIISFFSLQWPGILGASPPAFFLAKWCIGHTLGTGNSLLTCVPDPHHFDADPDTNPTFHVDADHWSYLSPWCGSGSGSYLPNKGSKPWKSAHIGHIPYILACHLQIDADPDLSYHFGPDTTVPFNLIRILPFLSLWSESRYTTLLPTKVIFSFGTVKFFL